MVLEATALSGLCVGERFARESARQYPEVARLLDRAAEIGYSFAAELREDELAGCRVFVEWLTPPVQMLVCGAGTDAAHAVVLRYPDRTIVVTPAQPEKCPIGATMTS